MKNFLIVILMLLGVSQIGCRLPFYYQLHNVQGSILDEDGKVVYVTMESRQRLIIENCDNKNLEEFLWALTLGKHGRRELEHLITTSTKMTVIISDKVGMYMDGGKYWVVMGLTGPSHGQSDSLIRNQASYNFWTPIFRPNKFVWVNEECTIEIFKGSMYVGTDSVFTLTNKNVTLYDLDKNIEITAFIMDTIKIEPFVHPDMMYQDATELYYFCGLHEIHHTRPGNIQIYLEGGDEEVDAMEIETKAYKRLKKINKKASRRE